ncbi:hypothetical protein FOCC_FOCC016886 [Frankliniella occidentalis]|nr:hypothetical protein FOCC_FOCC016886 [Frankliniella occidentalis]
MEFQGIQQFDRYTLRKITNLQFPVWLSQLTRESTLVIWFAQNKAIVKALRTIVQKHVQVDPSPTVGKFWCDTCRKHRVISEPKEPIKQPKDPGVEAAPEGSPILGSSKQRRKVIIGKRQKITSSEQLKNSGASEKLVRQASSSGSSNLSPQIQKLFYVQRKNVACGKRKIERVTEQVTKRICKTLDIDKNDLITEEAKKASDLDRMLAELKQRLPHVSKQEKYQLLTLCPASWSVRKAAEYFSVHRSVIENAIILRNKSGICSLPLFKRVERVSLATRKLVVKCFCDDKNSKILPGMKDKFKAKMVCASWGSWHTCCLCLSNPPKHHSCSSYALGINDDCSEVIALFVCDPKIRECMLNICEKCQRLHAVQALLQKRVLQNVSGDFLVDPDDEDDIDAYLKEKVEYKQWKSTDRTELVSQICSRSDLMEVAAEELLKLIPHDYIAKTQGAYVRNAKQSLDCSKVLVLMDFSMNYSCLVQGEVQSYHWSKTQVTVHPVCVYYRENLNDDETKLISICFLSDDLTHDVFLVNKFQELTISFIKDRFPQVVEVEYITDGCSQQHKSKGSFYNLCNHERQFGIKVTHTFFATSHGKSACDSIGMRIQFCLVPKQEVELMRAQISFKNVIAVPGTRSFHFYVPLSDDTVGCKFTSADTSLALVHSLTKPVEKSCNVSIGDFVVAKVARKKFIAYVSDVNGDEREVEVFLLNPKLPRRIFTFPDELNSQVLPSPHILCAVELKEEAENKYSLTSSSITKLKQLKIV